MQLTCEAIAANAVDNAAGLLQQRLHSADPFPVVSCAPLLS